jgi:hypothetical protein
MNKLQYLNLLFKKRNINQVIEHLKRKKNYLTFELKWLISYL